MEPVRGYSKEKANMNLSLGMELAPRGGVEASLARFEQWGKTPDSPVRAIRHQPARPGEFAPIPVHHPPGSAPQHGNPRIPRPVCP